MTAENRLADTFPGLVTETLRCGALFNSEQWRRAWARCPVESVFERDELVREGADGGRVTVPLAATSDSALWRGYEDDAGVRAVLTGPVTYASSLYAISNPLNRCSPERVADVVDEGVDRARAWGTQALVVTNLEPGPALERLRAERPPDATVRLDATCRTRLPGSTAEFFAGLGRSARSDLRRRTRRAQEQGVRFQERTGAAAREVLPELHALTADTARWHGNAPLYDLATLDAVLDVDGARLFTAEHEGAVLAGSLSLLHRGCLVVWAAGVRHQALHTHHPYIFLLNRTVEWAIDHGCEFLDFGRGTFEFKLRHGFHRTDLHTLFYLTDRHDGLVDRLRDMDTRIERFLGF